MKKWGIAILLIVILAALYFVELSKINSDNETSEAMPTLDNLRIDEAARNWENFYKVRVQIIDGQNAEFSIPKELLEAKGKEMKLSGAAVFFSPGVKWKGEKIAVHSFFLYPSLGLANACEHLPEVAMRWTIRVNLNNEWLISKTDMIQSFVIVEGTFRIDTSKPYESAFFLDQAVVEMLPKKKEEI